MGDSLSPFNLSCQALLRFVSFWDHGSTFSVQLSGITQKNFAFFDLTKLYFAVMTFPVILH